MSAQDTAKVALITGGAKRIGAYMARFLHAKGMNVVIHYRHSSQEAHALCDELNAIRANSALALQVVNLNSHPEVLTLVNKAHAMWHRLDVLINNASSFYPTPIGQVEEDQWNDLFCSNLKAPFFISQAATLPLKQTKGCIINITDIHADRPLRNYSVYCMAKAGLVMMTKSLAKELAPDIRVNAIAPGNILWPLNAELPEDLKQELTERVALKRKGEPEDIAKAAWFLIEDAGYITGQVIAVDGGRLLHC
jgi:pteridine reductase